MNRKKLVSLLLALMMLCAVLAGCSNTPADAGTTDAGTADAGATDAGATGADATDAAEEEPFRVAMILVGAINDAGWNESAYNGLVMAQEQLGVEIAYTESVQQADFETVMRDYASQGYDMVICVGNEFSDAVLNVAPSFTDVMFGVMNGNSFQEPNVAAYRFNTPETGFLAGAIAALYSQSGVVGMIGGSTFPHIKDCVEAFAKGAEYINPDVKALTGYTESMTDVALGKEMGMAFIEQGADVLSANANACGLGVIDAAASKGIRHIGYTSDQNDVAPETVMVSAIQSNEFMILAMVRSGVEKTFTPALHLYGMKEGAIYLSDFHGHDAELPEGGMDKINEIIAGIQDGSLKEQGILPKSVFEAQ